jgi:anti-sigma B factor antagonist
MDMIEVTHEAGVAVITPTTRRLDAAAAPEFKQSVVHLIEGGAHQLVLDLNRVEFLDSSGLGAMVSILKALGGRGTVVVCNAQGSVLSLFKLTRMDKVFAIVGTRQEALARLGG